MSVVAIVTRPMKVVMGEQEVLERQEVVAEGLAVEVHVN